MMTKLKSCWSKHYKVVFRIIKPERADVCFIKSSNIKKHLRLLSKAAFFIPHNLQSKNQHIFIINSIDDDWQCAQLVSKIEVNFFVSAVYFWLKGHDTIENSKVIFCSFIILRIFNVWQIKDR